MVVETLDRPFETWRDGLLEVIPTLDDPERCAVFLARLRTTAQRIGVTSDDVAWLAALVPSTATAVDPAPPDASKAQAREAEAADGTNVVAFGVEPSGAGSPASRPSTRDPGAEIYAALPGMASAQDKRLRSISDSFPAGDPRRLLAETVLGIAAAELADQSNALGQNDPFTRLAWRLSLWFSPSEDRSRFGQVLDPKAATQVRELVLELANELAGPDAPAEKAALRAWAGRIAARPGTQFEWLAMARLKGRDVSPVWSWLRTETRLALFDELPWQDDYAAALEAERKFDWDDLLWVPPGSDTETAAFADTLAELAPTGSDSASCLLADVTPALSELRWAPADEIEPTTMPRLLRESLRLGSELGLSAFARGPLPLKRNLVPWLASQEPLLADLLDAIAVDDWGDRLWSWHMTWRSDLGERDHDELLTLHSLVTRAFEHGDIALCDIMLGCHLLMLGTPIRRPISDVSEVVRLIRMIPSEDRASVNAVLGRFRGQVEDNLPGSRHLRVLLSLLPPVPRPTAMSLAEEVEDWIGAKRWKLLDQHQQERLVAAEKSYRLGRDQIETEASLWRGVVVDLCAVAEKLLKQAAAGASQAAGVGVPKKNAMLGAVVGDMRSLNKRAVDQNWQTGAAPRCFLVSVQHLSQLEECNNQNKPAKHMTGVEVGRPEATDVRLKMLFGGLLHALIDAAFGNSQV